MSLSLKQKNDLRSLDRLDSHARATVIYKTRGKLGNDLNDLADIEFMLSHLPRDHAKKAVRDKHVVSAMKILLSLLDLREFKRVRQNSPGDDGYVIKKIRKKHQRAPLTQKDYNRYKAMRHFATLFKTYFNPRVTLPGEPDFMDIPTPPRPIDSWICLDDRVDYKIHQQLHGESFERSEEGEDMEDIIQNRIREHIEACEDYNRFFKTTH